MKNEVSGHWKKLVSDPKYLSEADFMKMPEFAATISATTNEKVQNASGKSDKTVVHFAENIKPMVLNVTNSKSIAKVAKTPLVEKWKGVRIQLYFDPKVKFAGDVVGGVRVRPFAPTSSAGKVEGKQIPCEVCGENIKPFANKTTEGMAAYTKEKYGKEMCADCATKAAKADEEAKNEEELNSENN